MEIQFKQVSTALDKLRVYSLRKKVFVDEEKRFPYSLDHIVDQYDTFEETVNFIAIFRDEIIASVRLVMDGQAGLPIEKYQDLKKFKNQLEGGCFSIGWLCCTKPYRHNTGLIKALVEHALLHAEQNGFRHMISVIHPPAYDLLHNCFKVEKRGTQFIDEQRDIPMLTIYATTSTMLNHLNSNASSTKTSKVQAKAYQFHGKYHFLEEALSRNIGIFSLAEQDRLINCKIAVPGLGGVGGQHLVTLARTGINNFHIADFDIFEPVNFNRQYGAKTSGFGKEKIDIMYKEAKDINPYLNIKCFPKGITEKNIDEFLEGVDLVVDGMDFFNFDIRRLIFKKAHANNIPVITAGPLGFSAAMVIFMPDRGMTFDEYFNINDNLDTEEKLIRFFIGLAPRASQRKYIDPGAINMRAQKGPSLGAACQLCSSVVAAEAVRILLKKKDIKPAPWYFQYDLFTRKFYQGYLKKGNKKFSQKIKSKLIKKSLTKNKLVYTLPDFPKLISGDKTISEDIIKYLINAGCKAPSGDNCQPWTFEFSEKKLVKVFLDHRADNSFFNVNQTASYIACGAAIENITLAASRYNIQCKTQYLPDEKENYHVANINLALESTKEDPLQRFIWERHTNRTKYNRQPIGQKDFNQIKQSIQSFKGASIKLVSDRKDINQIAKMIYEVDKIRVERKDLHKHLMQMIRFTDKDALLKKDGFPLKNLEAGAGGELFLRACSPWAVMKLMNKMGMGKLISQIAGKSIKQASAIGLLKINGKSDKDLIVGGQALERLWLTTSRLGISFQPMTAVTLFKRRWDLGMQDDFSLEHQQLLGNVWPMYENLFGSDKNKSHIMLFRLGYGKRISCGTLRKNHI